MWNYYLYEIQIMDIMYILIEIHQDFRNIDKIYLFYFLFLFIL